MSDRVSLGIPSLVVAALALLAGFFVGRSGAAAAPTDAPSHSTVVVAAPYPASVAARGETPVARRSISESAATRVADLRSEAAELLREVRGRHGTVVTGGSTAAQRAEQRRMRGMTRSALFEELRRSAHPIRMSASAAIRSYGSALAAAEVLLTGEMEGPERSRILTLKAIAQRKLGDADGAEATLRLSVSAAAASQRERIEALAQLGFSAVFRQDFQLAADRFLDIANAPDTGDELRARFTHLSALNLENVDVRRALAQHQLVVDEFAGSSDKHVGGSAEASQRRIDALEQ